MITRRSCATRAHTHAHQSPPGLPNAGLPSNLITFNALLVFWKIQPIDCNARQSLNVKLHCKFIIIIARRKISCRNAEKKNQFLIIYFHRFSSCGKISRYIWNIGQHNCVKSVLNFILWMIFSKKINLLILTIFSTPKHFIQIIKISYVHFNFIVTQ